MPEPIVSSADGVDPEHEALLADSVGLALLVVLETLDPAERLAFVLHDMFAMPFDEIAPLVDRSPAAARQLASRARRRVRGARPRPTPISSASARWSTPSSPRRARVTSTRSSRCSTRTSCFARTAALCARACRRRSAAQRRWPSRRSCSGGSAEFARPALVNGAAGLVSAPEGKPFSVLGFTIAGGKIVEIDILADPERLSELDLTVLEGGA